MNDNSRAHRIAEMWRAHYDPDFALPMRRAVEIIETAFREKRDPASDLAAALVRAREADAARDAYVHRLALAYAMRREDRSETRRRGRKGEVEDERLPEAVVQPRWLRHLLAERAA
jgi:hypothetical protein